MRAFPFCLFLWSPSRKLLGNELENSALVSDLLPVEDVLTHGFDAHVVDR